MDLYYATTNYSKFQSLQRRFNGDGVALRQVAVRLSESEPTDVMELVRNKVERVFNSIGKPVVAIETGFYVHKFNGLPRTFTSSTMKTVRIDDILEFVRGKDKEERYCELRECLAYLDTLRSQPKYFHAMAKGTLSCEARGIARRQMWSKLTPIFIPEGGHKTLGEMDHDEFVEWSLNMREKNSVSRQFVDWFKSERA